MTMSNLHPGFILIAVGLIALFVPKSLRRPVLAAGPLLGLGAVLTLAPECDAAIYQRDNAALSPCRRAQLDFRPDFLYDGGYRRYLCLP